MSAIPRTLITMSHKMRAAVRRSKATTTSTHPDTHATPESASTGPVWRPRAYQTVTAPYSVCVNDSLDPAKLWVPIEDAANLATARDLMRRTQLMYPHVYVRVYDNSRGAFISDHPVFGSQKTTTTK